MGATQVVIHSDSQLVARQLKGTYKIKNDWHKRYAEAYEKARASFQKVALKEAFREEYKKANVLIRMASALQWNDERVVVKVELVAYIDQPLDPN